MGETTMNSWSDLEKLTGHAPQQCKHQANSHPTCSADPSGQHLLVPDMTKCHLATSKPGCFSANQPTPLSAHPEHRLLHTGPKLRCSMARRCEAGTERKTEHIEWSRGAAKTT
jgi:hypothetical protein